MNVLSPPQVPMLFLELDGIVRRRAEDLDRPLRGPLDIEVFPSAVERMRLWKEAGGRIVGFTQQPGVALGEVEEEMVVRANWTSHERAGNLFDVVVHCPHHPDADLPHLARCWCRLPRPGLLIEPSSPSWALAGLRTALATWAVLVVPGPRRDSGSSARRAVARPDVGPGAWCRCARRSRGSRGSMTVRHRRVPGAAPSVRRRRHRLSRTVRHVVRTVPTWLLRTCRAILPKLLRTAGNGRDRRRRPFAAPFREMSTGT